MTACPKNATTDEMMTMEDKVRGVELQKTKETVFCPLFMDGLPKDFSTNPQLAALVSLMNDDDDDDKPIKKHVEEVPLHKQGGGKIDRKSRQRHKRQDNPYTKPLKKKTPPASVAEAHLFLKMWSISK